MRMCVFCSSANQIQGNRRIPTEKSLLIRKIICAIKHGISNTARTILVTNNLLAFSSKMADIAATGTDKRSVTLLSIFKTRSVRAVAGNDTSRTAKSRGFYSNLLAIAVDNMDDNVSRSSITAIS